MTTPAQAPADLPDAPPDEDLSIDPEHRSYQRMSLRGPAVIVVGIAAFILVGGILASILTAGGNPVLRLAWQPTAPGGEIMGSVVPFVAVALAGFLLLVGFVLRYVRHTAEAIEAKLRSICAHGARAG